MNRSPLLQALTLLLLFSSSVIVAADSDWRNNRLTPLQRITVGPWDNFAPTASRDGNTVYLTHTRNQVPQIYRMDVASRHSTPLSEAEGDAKTPALSPGGNWLAYISFRYDARGDTCLQPLPKGDSFCISSRNENDKDPFWIDSGHLGWLSSRPGDDEWQLQQYTLKEKRITTLYRGNISAPAASRDGHYILFNRQQREQLRDRLQPILFDRRLGSSRPLTPFDLPGVPGFYAFSLDGEDLYFNYYLGDTNHDQRIDGNDHSVTFRINFQQWLESSSPLLPLQITSVAENCVFPALADDSLFLTCAFEGSLDIYQAPLSGTVPAAWSREKIEEAHRIARTPEERLLLMNTLRFRDRQQGEPLNPDYLERLLSLHLETGDLSAVHYYLQQLQQIYAEKERDPRQLAQFYRGLEILTTLLSRQQREPQGMITARFERFTREVSEQAEELKSWPHLKTIIHATIAEVLQQNDTALTLLQRLPLSADTPETMLPLES
ncbi:MAG: PD40 domain-containing protein, partial [Gammaproteobacteria bacterium]|nr:PD40 domain-containing protein [Gammaproteobacteria bacterium]